MKITKYKHACLVVGNDTNSIIIDPGVFSDDLVIPNNVSGIVITHSHADHFNQDMLAKIVGQNPDTVIYANKEITSLVTSFPTETVSAGSTVQTGGFSLAFSGGTHAVIHSSMSTPVNLAVTIDDTLFYPGDSFILPETPIKVLALPISAPWMKTAEAMDYLAEVKPMQAFPTHDAILSENGQYMIDDMIAIVAGKIGTSYERIPPGTTLEVW